MIQLKNKIIYIGVLCFILILSIGLQFLDFESGMSRVHQHRVSPLSKAQENEGLFTTHLPIVEINTKGQLIPGSPIFHEEEITGFQTGPQGEEEVIVDFSLIDSQDGQNSLDDIRQVVTKANIRYRGNSSRFFDKKPMMMHFIDENGNENPQELAGLPKDDEWVLNGPFLDRTLIRNYMCLNIAGEIMEYAPNVRFCELFLDGEYQGLYLIIESVSRSTARINISKPEKNRDRTSYIVRWDRAGKGDHELNNLTTYTFKSDVSGLDVRYPGKKLITPGRMAYIEKDISKIEKVIYSYDLYESDYNYSEYIDVRAFAQYFIINEFFGNVDAGRFSTFYYKDIRGKLKPCVWDFNNACDNYIDYTWDEAGFTMLNAPWFSMLIKDQVFVDKIIDEYHRLRQGVLSETYLLNYIDETIAYLDDAIERNYQVWGYVFDLDNADGLNFLSPIERNYPSYEEAVEQLKDYIIQRGRWLDEHIDTLYQYAHPSKNSHFYNQ